MSRRRVVRPAHRVLRASGERVDEKRDGAWNVRFLTGATSAKSYTCPGCSTVIRPATPHVLVWPVQKPLLSASAIDERRHWHTSCWSRRA